MVTLDEIGHWSDGIVPDGDPRDPTNRRARREGFWGTILAGGAGADWYYGSDPFEYNDIWVEDFTVRAEFFQRTNAGIEMIEESCLPFWEMETLNEVSSIEEAWVFGQRGESYFVYAPEEETIELNLLAGRYSVLWFDTFAGGALQHGAVDTVDIETDSAWVSIGEPIDFEEDAVAVITRLPPIVNTAAEEEVAGKSSMLKQNYPNPVLTTTTIEFDIQQASPVELRIYDTLGREVRMVEDEILVAGTHRYEVDLSGLPAGVYFYRLSVGVEQLVRSMLRL